MSSFDVNEKIWFVYRKDSHEGPFSLLELEKWLAEGSLLPEHFVWKEGMADWKKLQEVPDFRALLEKGSYQPPPPPAAPPPGAIAQEPSISHLAPEPTSKNDSEPSLELTPLELTPVEEFSIETPQGEEKPSSKQAPSLKASATPKISVDASERTTREEEPTGKITVSQQITGKKRRKKSFLSKLFFLLIFLAALVGGGYFLHQKGFLESFKKYPITQNILEKTQVGAKIAWTWTETTTETFLVWVRPHLVSFVQKIPVLKDLLSPVGHLKTISALEKKALKKAILTSRTEGWKLEAALSTDNLLRPMFYIGSNLPNETVFEVYLKALPKTLLQAYQYFAEQKILLKQGLGKTQPFSFHQGPLPLGKYFLYVTESPNQTASIQSILSRFDFLSIAMPSFLKRKKKILKTKIYFLGGKENTQYQTQLKLYHEKLFSLFQKEKLEFQQFSKTLFSQFQATALTFQKLKARRSRKNKRKWKTFQRKWIPLQKSLLTSFQNWHPTLLASHQYFETLTSLFQKAYQATTHLQEQYALYFWNPNYKKIRSQLMNTLSQTEVALSNLKEKWAEIETLDFFKNLKIQP